MPSSLPLSGAGFGIRAEDGSLFSVLVRSEPCKIGVALAVRFYASMVQGPSAGIGLVSRSASPNASYPSPNRHVLRVASCNLANPPIG